MSRKRNAEGKTGNVESEVTDKIDNTEPDDIWANADQGKSVELGDMSEELKSENLTLKTPNSELSGEEAEEHRLAREWKDRHGDAILDRIYGLSGGGKMDAMTFTDPSGDGILICAVMRIAKPDEVRESLTCKSFHTWDKIQTGRIHPEIGRVSDYLAKGFGKPRDDTDFPNFRYQEAGSHSQFLNRFLAAVLVSILQYEHSDELNGIGFCEPLDLGGDLVNNLSDPFGNNPESIMKKYGMRTEE